MGEANHPYCMTHFESTTGQMAPACRPVAIVVSADPHSVTCPTCQACLRRLEAFLEFLATLDDDAAGGA